jgi:hypothetical protein
VALGSWVAVSEGVVVALGVAEGVVLAPGITVVVPVDVEEGGTVGVEEERAVDVPVGDGLEVCVGVGVEVGVGMRVAVSVGKGVGVGVDEGNGEGVGVVEPVATLCCGWGGPAAGGLAADARYRGSQMEPPERVNPTKSKSRVGWRTSVLRVMIAPFDPRNFQYYSEFKKLVKSFMVIQLSPHI